MSVTIHWRPVDDKGKHFQGGTSDSFDKLRTVFGNTIEAKGAVMLRAMEVASGNDFFGEVASVVEQYGDIEIWGEY